jgi:hypothetical protein
MLATLASAAIYGFGDTSSRHKTVYSRKAQYNRDASFRQPGYLMRPVAFRPQLAMGLALSANIVNAWAVPKYHFNLIEKVYKFP